MLATQEPAEHMSPPKQPMQTRPPVPQAWVDVPGTQRPVVSQQPLAHVVGLHAGVPPPVPPPAEPPPIGLVQTPPVQTRPVPQVTHMVPPMPHAPRVVPPWQTPFMSQQPAAQFCGLQPLAAPPPPVPVPPPVAAPPPEPPSRKKKPPPEPPVLPPSKSGVWQVPALQT